MAIDHFRSSLAFDHRNSIGMRSPKSSTRFPFRHHSIRLIPFRKVAPSPFQRAGPQTALPSCTEGRSLSTIDHPRLIILNRSQKFTCIRIKTTAEKNRITIRRCPNAEEMFPVCMGLGSSALGKIRALLRRFRGGIYIYDGSALIVRHCHAVKGTSN
jgi:hypothetical protein